MIIEILGIITLVMTVGSFLWMARSDYRHLDAKIDSMKELVHAIHLEMKDFHARLCAIEEKRSKP